MFKFMPKLLLLSTVCLVYSFQALAEDEKLPVAGEVSSHSRTTPHVDFNPRLNLTGFFTPKPIERDSDDIYFSADEIQNDKNTNVITAIGDVYIIREDTTIKADKIIYNQDLDVIMAVGNVVMVDQTDNVVYADEMILHDKMSRGSLNKLKVIMRDESRIWASKIKSLENKNKVLYNASYTPCDCCMEEEGKDKKEPLWKISASKITQDIENQNVYYRNAFLRVKDFPVFYTPFFSHPDPSVKRRSGMLLPTYGSSGFLGAYIQTGYFWAIDDHSDLIFKPYFSASHGIVPYLLYQKYLQNGDFSVYGNFVKDNDKDKLRGYVNTQARYELNENWLAKLDAKYVSDSRYLRDLSLSEKTDAWLTSSLKFEYFNNRDYADIEADYFRVVSYNLSTSNAQSKFNGSYVLPYLNYEKYNQLTDFGLYTKNTFNFASVIYNKEHANAERGTMINELVLPYTSRWGEKIKLTGSVKSDFYYIDKYLNNDGRTFTGTVGRVFPQLGAEWKLPFIKANEDSRQIIEPIIVGVLAPNDNNKLDRIPNLDSENAFLDDVNVLDLDRYSGYDVNDTGSRISYGLNWSSYGNILGRTQAFIAQSYYFNDEDSFSQSLGNRSHFSDIVGRVYAAPNEYLDLNYRFRLDKDDFEIKYNELSASFGPRMLRAYVSYIHLNDENNTLGGNGKKTGRHELYTSLSAKLSRDWTLRIYNRQDLSAGSSYSLEHGGSLIYEDECFALSGNVQRYDSIDPDVENNYEFSVSFLLKTIGGIGSK